MNDELQEVSLETLGGGAAIERFNYELEKVLENIGDPNTKADAMREVTLKIRIKPNEDRSFCVVEIQVNGKLASIKPEHSSFHLTKRGNRMVATEYNPRQESFEFKKVEVVK